MKITHKIYNRTKSHAIYFLLFITMSGGLTSSAIAQSSGNLSFEMTPSPLVVNLKPASETMLEFQLRNSGKSVEWLKVEPRQFTTDKYGKLAIDYAKQPQIANWIQIQTPKFTLGPGQWFNQQFSVRLPEDAAHSNSFVFVISRVEGVTKEAESQAPNESVVIPVIINVEKPGALRKLEIERVVRSSGQYEYSPATIDVHLKNAGNVTIVPIGKIDIKRDGKDADAITTFLLNKEKDFLLPGSTRIFRANWLSDGFPRSELVTLPDGTSKTNEIWELSQIGNMRIGQYIADVEVTYSNGLKDIALSREVAFWVFPWRIIISSVVFVLLVAFVVWIAVKKSPNISKRKAS